MTMRLLVLGDLLRTGYLPSAYMADEGTMEKRYLIMDTHVNVQPSLCS
ncbi:MAG: hypothetical protein JRN37_07400 [Nitrososphaerota archaeon]|nr:hypothetical protein [Nitrososphaerota archaeon]MDG7038958.1 hypothetical protein [Nitrososphaerota archaeon]MDG7041243.1 hypothetical protein [Nitrososphaerota archaeon]